MTIVFSSERITELRQHPNQIHGMLVVPSFSVRRQSKGERHVRHFYREYKVLDGEGQDTGKRLREPVQDVFDGEIRKAWLTVLMVETVDIDARKASHPLRVLDDSVAKACGFATVTVARDVWETQHPHSPFAKLIWFALGDHRDRELYLRRYIWRGGDYSGHPGDDVIDHLPALTPEQLREVAAHARQRDTQRRAATASVLAQQTLAQRVARLESAGENMRKEIRCELTIIGDRRDRGLRKLRKITPDQIGPKNDQPDVHS